MSLQSLLPFQKYAALKSEVLCTLIFIKAASIMQTIIVLYCENKKLCHSI